MGFLSNLFKKSKPKNPEDDFKVTITNELIKIEHPQRKIEQIQWQNIEQIKLINTDEGPWFPDAWLTLLGKNEGCLIHKELKVTMKFTKLYQNMRTLILKM